MIEDLTVRLAGLDQDGRDKIIVIVIESDALRGASVMVLGLYDSPNGKTLKEKARSLGLPFAGSTQWMCLILTATANQTSPPSSPRT